MLSGVVLPHSIMYDKGSINGIFAELEQKVAINVVGVRHVGSVSVEMFELITGILNLQSFSCLLCPISQIGENVTCFSMNYLKPIYMS